MGNLPCVCVCVCVFVCVYVCVYVCVSVSVSASVSVSVAPSSLKLLGGIVGVTLQDLEGLFWNVVGVGGARRSAPCVGSRTRCRSRKC